MQFKNILVYPFENEFIAAVFFTDDGEDRIILQKGADPGTAVRIGYGKFLDDPYSYCEKVHGEDAAV